MLLSFTIAKYEQRKTWHPCSPSLLRETQACWHCHNKTRSSTFKERWRSPKRNGEKIRWERELKEEWDRGWKRRNSNKQSNIQAFPGFASIHRIYQPQSLINSFFPAKTKQQNKSRLIRIGKISGGRLSSSSRQSNWKRPNDVHFV